MLTGVEVVEGVRLICADMAGFVDDDAMDEGGTTGLCPT